MSAQFTLFFDGHLWVGVYEIDDGETLRAARVIFGKEPNAAELYEFVREHGTELVWRAHSATPVAIENKADVARRANAHRQAGIPRSTDADRQADAPKNDAQTSKNVRESNLGRKAEHPDSSSQKPASKTRRVNPKRAQRMAAKAMRERGVSTKAQEALKADMDSRGKERASAQRRKQKQTADEAYARKRAKARQKHRGH